MDVQVLANYSYQKVKYNGCAGLLKAGASPIKSSTLGVYF